MKAFEFPNRSNETLGRQKDLGHATIGDGLMTVKGRPGGSSSGAKKSARSGDLSDATPLC